ncbi:hypothetical protein KUV26_23195 [Leisingera daeponensis]|uniref:Uncharacterized protein n=1 Tax=Leisingera daeponensis TaxID=405746 RepID=A0ABS7NQA6_9RHOB|nr:hypothetical protein [Leisingera daeponensis]MBY6142341.1 hypothetical protein [Leisingera daeponensis]
MADREFPEQAYAVNAGDAGTGCGLTSSGSSIETQHGFSNAAFHTGKSVISPPLKAACLSKRWKEAPTALSAKTNTENTVVIP